LSGFGRHARLARTDDRVVPELSRSQLLVYGAVAVALLLVGARWVRSASAESTPAGDADVAGLSTGAEAETGDAFALDPGDDGDLVVHVAGAVRQPGVYKLPAGSRVADAIERAGGSTGVALADGINLAAPLADGQQVVMPARAKGPAGVAPASGIGAAAADPAQEGPISLGTATVEQLDTIEGIGPVTAQDIIEFRDQHGGLSSIDDLDEISGIGPATMEALRARLQP
jgi:competence protein ComEA